MPLFGHIQTCDDGTVYAIDVHEHPDAASYQAWAAAIPGSDTWQIEMLPDGTVSGARSSGSAWVNPAPPPAPPEPAPAPGPTKDQLLAQIQALTAQLAAAG